MVLVVVLLGKKYQRVLHHRWNTLCNLALIRFILATLWLVHVILVLHFFIDVVENGNKKNNENIVRHPQQPTQIYIYNK